ncbi:hypothetical protein F2Q68_00015945 [Brassica cretica]|uniref:Uncharacterized protein n=1 Tax=Brassica cretica TaxID=69181 RepID=A0A8S9HHV7_BRACR|nr:hypothetical protein F2Q68_00015945 [Brassica cretica]
MTLTALPKSTRIFEKMVPVSSNVMTKASSWGMSSLATSSSWKFIVLNSRIIPSEDAASGSLVACREVSDYLSLERQSCLWRGIL